MNEMKWNARFNIGVDSIDKAHQRLFSIVGKLIALNEDTAKQKHACREGIKYFKNYTAKHFADEEAYMQSIDYKGYAIHKSLHDNMRNKTIPALEAELDEKDYSLEAVQHFLGICIGWLNAHIMIEDHAITGRVSNRWVHQPSEEQMDSLIKAVIQNFQSLFRMNARIISDHYNGEDFSSGNALCFRLNYHTEKKEKIQIYLVYEEHLIFRILNQLLGKQITQIDKTVIYAFKTLSQKFMSCVGEHFVLTDSLQLERNDQLTFDQLLRIFEKVYPPYSLLFNTTGNGYFAICINPDTKLL